MIEDSSEVESGGWRFPGGKPVPKAVVATGLCRAVLSGEWEPGRRLIEVELAERFGVSRTPVREALLELSGLGMVELRRNCGAVLGAFGPREVREIYGVRSILEVEATRQAVGHFEAGALERLRKSFVEMLEGSREDEDWVLDQELHGMIAAASKNRRLAGEIARYGDLVQAVRETVAAQLDEIHVTTAKQHVGIIDQLIAEDSDGAASAMREHLRQAAESAIRAVEGMRGTKKAALTS